jgi:hypothetical protein
VGQERGHAHGTNTRYFIERDPVGFFFHGGEKWLAYGQDGLVAVARENTLGGCSCQLRLLY